MLPVNIVFQLQFGYSMNADDTDAATADPRPYRQTAKLF